MSHLDAPARDPHNPELTKSAAEVLKMLKEGEFGHQKPVGKNAEALNFTDADLEGLKVPEENDRKKEEEEKRENLKIVYGILKDVLDLIETGKTKEDIEAEGFGKEYDSDARHRDHKEFYRDLFAKRMMRMPIEKVREALAEAQDANNEKKVSELDSFLRRIEESLPGALWIELQETEPFMQGVESPDAYQGTIREGLKEILRAKDEKEKERIADALKLTIIERMDELKEIKEADRAKMFESAWEKLMEKKEDAK